MESPIVYKVAWYLTCTTFMFDVTFMVPKTYFNIFRSTANRAYFIYQIINNIYNIFAFAVNTMVNIKYAIN